MSNETITQPQIYQPYQVYHAGSMPEADALVAAQCLTGRITNAPVITGALDMDKAREWMGITPAPTPIPAPVAKVPMQTRKVYEVNEWMQVYRNQGYRAAQVLAVHEDPVGNRTYLIEYHMPRLWSALNFVNQYVTDMDINDSRYYVISYKKLATAWLTKMTETGAKWCGKGYGRKKYPQAGEMLTARQAAREKAVKDKAELIKKIRTLPTEPPGV